NFPGGASGKREKSKFPPTNLLTGRRRLEFWADSRTSAPTQDSLFSLGRGLHLLHLQRNARLLASIHGDIDGVLTRLFKFQLLDVDQKIPGDEIGLRRQ